MTQHLSFTQTNAQSNTSEIKLQLHTKQQNKLLLQLMAARRAFHLLYYDVLCKLTPLNH